MILGAAPIQDAIYLARFIGDTTKGFIRFSVGQAKTVVAPLNREHHEHEGFQWVSAETLLYARTQR